MYTSTLYTLNEYRTETIEPTKPLKIKLTLTYNNNFIKLFS